MYYSRESERQKIKYLRRQMKMTSLLENSSIIIVLVVLGVSLLLLSKGADTLVDNAVKLSKTWGLPEIIIGATIVSLGTTLPELSASVTSALQCGGNFALGNAVGSIITNTSLIIGIGALFGKIPVDKKSSQKLSLLIIAVLLLVLPTIPYKIVGNVGRIPQWMGIIFLILIPVYMYFLVYQEKKNSNNEKEKSQVEKSKENVIIIVGKIILAAVVIALSAAGLVGSAETLAVRIGIPDLVIASTLVAFGTSVPELSTCIAAAKRKHGGLALGNIMGANVLNILMVVGASVALTPGGIGVSQDFYSIHFIALGLIVSIFGYFAYNSKFDEISKKEGIILILFYTVYLGANVVSAFI
jgi:cation:H+ antiporter